jgi:ParB-like chromosome segregation protein Spo0J
MMRPRSNRADRPKGCLSHSAVEHQPITSLKPHLRNPRKHSKRQIEQIADSIQAFGFVNPVLIDSESRVIAGHGRVEAARRLGVQEVPTIRVDHMTEAEKRAYAIADNRLAELAGWDRDLLRIEFAYIAELDIDATAIMSASP